MSLTHVDLFIPNSFLEYGPCNVYGISKQDLKGYKINCVCISIEESNNINNDIKKFIASSSGDKLCFGTIDKSNSTLREVNEIYFDIRTCPNDKLLLNNFYINGEMCESSFTIIMYNSEQIHKSELLPTPAKNTFVNFLNEISVYAINSPIELDNKAIFAVQKRTSLFKNFLISLLLFIFYPLHKVFIFFQYRTPEKVCKLFTISATGRQVLNKFHTSNSIYKMLQKGEISLMCGNLILALFLDWSLGIIITWAIKSYLDSEELFESAMEKTEIVVNDLQKLLHWLMGVPAGLKLNRPLNTVCGRFFLYHIYLWKTYIVVIKPNLLTALNISTNFGVFGTTFLLSLINDFISLATIHIYFFYIYAARLYELKISGCICLWRLFRGKKWNPLRSRVDSYFYDVQQLFIGTLIFTIIIFLLPTVAVYYFVFTLLRVLMLCFFTCVSKIIALLSILPVYVVFLQILRHNFIKGDIIFQMSSCSSNMLLMTMKAILISWSELLKRTLPKKNHSSEVTWGSLSYSLIRGKIIYPL